MMGERSHGCPAAHYCDLCRCCGPADRLRLYPHATTPARPSWNAAPAKLSKEELGELLAQFQDTYEATIRHAANRIVDQQPDRATRRRSLLWQTRLIPMMRDALDQSDALQALVDAWALCLRDQHFFTDGDGRDMFGPDQAIAREATRRSLAAIEQIAAHFLPPETLDRARGAVDELARRHPLRGEFSGTAVRAAVQPVEREADVLATIMRAPMAPFRAFEGIDRGAAAIQGFTAVAARMTDTVQDLPESARLQTQLLVMELEELETIQAALASLQELTRSAARISTVAEQLPENLRRELALAAEDLEARQAQFQQTLRDAQEVAGRVNETLGRVETAAASVERTATHAAMAGDAWTQTVQAVSDLVVSFREPGPAAGAGAPADQLNMSRLQNRPGGPWTTRFRAERDGGERIRHKRVHAGRHRAGSRGRVATAIDRRAARVGRLGRAANGPARAGSPHRGGS
jgi:hypothetical protein